jgi:uncharacterized protein YecE (DUF72 family)
MNSKDKYIVGTSGYSFADWIGPFYPPGTTRREMFSLYASRFHTVEINYTFYRMPAQRTIRSLALRSRPGFDFWIKANQQITHEADRSVIPPFAESLQPMREMGKLAGVLLQFPQSFHRTVGNRKHLAAVIEAFAPIPLAVEFRHFSWQHPATTEGLRDRNVSLVVPDVPRIDSLYRPEPALTSRVGYLRLHSRKKENWYAGAVERYDYSYSRQEMRELLAKWSDLAEEADRVYTFFNNCHRGQAALNAEAFRRLMGQIP